VLIRKELFSHNKVSSCVSLIRLTDGWNPKPLSKWGGNPKGVCLFLNNISESILPEWMSPASENLHWSPSRSIYFSITQA